MRSLLLAAALVLLAGSLAWAEDVVPAGKGSYASAPPPWTDGLDNAHTQKEADRTFHVMAGNVRPIPTNNWHTHLFLEGGANCDLWADPVLVRLQGNSTELVGLLGWNRDGGGMDRAQAIKLGGKGFKGADTVAKDWSDWMLQYRVTGDAQSYYDVTLGRGMPCVWVEYSGVTPTITFGNGATFFDLDGAAGALPAKGNAFGVTLGAAKWAVFAPEDTGFENAGGTVTVTFSGAKKYLVFAYLSNAKDISTFAKCAYAIPRKTTLSWKYDPKAGEVKQTWTVTTEPLKGSQNEIVQGWIPHHYRTTKLGFKLADMEYACPRGKLKTAVGNTFEITYPFVGLLPMQPAPEKTGLANDFDEARMRDFLAKYATHDKLGQAGTYWGGKELLQWGQYMNIGVQMKDPTAAQNAEHLKTTLSDWLTYTKGPDKSADRIFFFFYPNYKGLVGWHEEFWSYQFTDHHFHYGYFTMAAALLGLQDPQWLKDYGPMISLVAKDYANWDHKDQRFPLFRCFDVWEGHCWARGPVPNNGPDEESSSEAVQSWGGLFLLGAALGDEDMMGAGAMGWCCETQAAQEYWFNRYGDVWSPNFAKPMVGMVFASGHAYANFFTGDMAWTYGIQLMPNSPALQYFAQDPVFFKKHWQKLMKSTRQTEEPDAAILDKMGPGLGNVMLAHSGYFDTEWTIKTIAGLIGSQSKLMDPLAMDNGVPSPGGLVYFNAYSLRSCGLPAFNCHTSLPISTVYFNAKTKVYTYAAVNPTSQPVDVTVYADGKAAGTFKAAPNAMTVTHQLNK
jgi:endoglucanase Acf2